MNIDTSIFKAYDIRGIYPSQLNEELVYKIARAYAEWLKKQNSSVHTVAVGGDMRLSTPSLKTEIIRGLLEAGLNVDDFGLVSSPSFYFAVANYGYAGGLQVSASHNPKEYNGIKVVSRGANPVGRDNGLFVIRDMVVNGELGDTSATPGKVRTQNNLPNPITDSIKYYSEFAEVDFQKIKNKNFKIVHDPANAMGILDFGPGGLLQKLGVELIDMNYELDGTFPNHEADPLKPENTESLREKVKSEKADLGIATDGDADRIFFVDDQGESIPQAIIRGILAQLILQKHPGSTICYDIRPGKVTRDMILSAGGQPSITPVGHTLIKNQMEKVGAVFGGESSGHFFYKLPIGIFEQPVLVALNLLNWLAEKDQPISQLVAPYKKYFESGEINFKVNNQSEVQLGIQSIKSAFPDNIASELDGVFIETPEVWFLVRGSNTEPLLRISLEGVSMQAVEAVKAQVLKILGK